MIVDIDGEGHLPRIVRCQSLEIVKRGIEANRQVAAVGLVSHIRDLHLAVLRLGGQNI
jgi:hypothetical protein